VALEHVAHDDRERVRRDADRVRVAVARAPAGGPDVRARDVAELGERVDERERDGALRGRARERVRDPGEERDERGVGLREEEERDVARGGVHRRHREHAADEAARERERDVPEALADGVRVARDGEGDERREDPGRGAEEERHRAVVAHRRGERREERVLQGDAGVRRGIGEGMGWCHLRRRGR
jgi:hypothetical protein